MAIDPGPFRGVLPLPISTLRVSLPILANPLNRGRAVTLSFDQFRYGWTNAIESDDEAKRLYDVFHVAAPGVALMQMANANLNPLTEAKVDTKNPDRGPLLITDGEKDHTRSRWRSRTPPTRGRSAIPASLRSRRSRTGGTR